MRSYVRRLPLISHRHPISTSLCLSVSISQSVSVNLSPSVPLSQYVSDDLSVYLSQSVSLFSMSLLVCLRQTIPVKLF